MAVVKKGGHAVTSVLSGTDHATVRAAQPNFPNAVTYNGGQGNGAPSAGSPVDVKSKKKFLNVARSR